MWVDKAGFVKLGKVADPDGHKRPVEVGWPQKEHGLAEATAWVGDGYGVGLAVHLCPDIAVIDLDSQEGDVQAFVEEVAKAGALVCKSPRGFHIFIKRREGITDRKAARLRYKEIEVTGEVYAGSSPRVIVLPILGTPRVTAFDGKVLYVRGRYLGRGVTLWELVEFLEDLPVLEGLEIAIGEADMDSEDAWRLLLGEEWKRVNQREALQALVDSWEKVGGRNNAVYHLARYWGYRGWDTKRLFNAAKTLFSDGDPEASNDWAGLRRTIEGGYAKGKAYRGSQQRRVTNIGRKSLSMDVLRGLMPGAHYADVGGRRYILYNGFAIPEEKFKGFAEFSLGISPTLESVNGIYAWLPYYFPEARDVLIVSYRLQYLRDKVFMLFRINDTDEVVVLMVKANEDGTFTVQEYGREELPEGVYIEFGARGSRRVDRKVFEVYKSWVRELPPFSLLGSKIHGIIRNLSDYFQGEPEDKRLAKALLAVATTVASQSVLAIVGPSGSGKTTFSKIIQTAINGDFATIGSEDLRDLLAVANTKKVIGFDEASQISSQFQAALKSIASGFTHAQRKLFTNDETVEMGFNCSFVLSVTNVEDVSPDLARRMTFLELPIVPNRRYISEEDLHYVLREKSALLGVGFMVLAAAAKSSVERRVDALDPDLFTVDYQGLPYWLAIDSKKDLARAYWNLCRYFGIGEGTAKSVWETSRQGAIRHGLGLWMDVIDTAEKDADIEERLREGLFISDLVDVIGFIGDIETDEDRKGSKKIVAKLTRTLGAAAGVMPMIGWSMFYEKRKNSKGMRRYFVKLFRVSNQPPNPEGPEGPKSSGGPSNGPSPVDPNPPSDTGFPPSNKPSPVDPNPPSDAGFPQAPVGLTSPQDGGAQKAFTQNGFDGVNGSTFGFMAVSRDRDPVLPFSEAKASGSLGDIRAFGEVPVHYLTRVGDVERLAWAMMTAEEVGVDLETTGLIPHKDKIRLISFALKRDGREQVYLVDVFRVPQAINVLRPFFDERWGPLLVGHNLKFDLSFLIMDKVFTYGERLRDTGLIYQILHASKTMPKLSDLYGGLDKVMQLSHWGGELSERHLRYAAEDALAALRVYRGQVIEVERKGLKEVMLLEMRALPAVAWLQTNGVPFNPNIWEEELARYKEKDGEVRQRLLEYGLLNGGPKHVRAKLNERGIQVENTREETLLLYKEDPFVATFLEYREFSKRVSTFGENWIRKYYQADVGRVFPNWQQIGAETGRMACRSPNMQQVPRDSIRRAFRSREGTVLVKADYSQIELRLAAAIAQDEVMIKAFQNGVDLHTFTAKRVLNKEEVSKADRQLAKALNFGLIYGMGAKMLRQYAKVGYGVDLTEEQAIKLRNEFFATYKGLRRWHASKRDGEEMVETLLGRKRITGKFSEKLNTPVQGSGADGLKLALATLYEHCGEMPGAYPILAVHDEIVLEAPREKAEEVGAWLAGIMQRSMEYVISQAKTPVPIEVEVGVFEDWGITPVESQKQKGA